MPAVPFAVRDGYAAIEAVHITPGAVIEINYHCPQKVTVEKAWRSGMEYKIRWTGDDIVDVIS